MQMGPIWVAHSSLGAFSRFERGNTQINPSKQIFSRRKGNQEGYVLIASFFTHFAFYRYGVCTEWVDNMKREGDCALAVFSAVVGFFAGQASDWQCS